MKIAACWWCGRAGRVTEGGDVACPCGCAAPGINAWNKLARLAEIGRLCEAMPEGYSLRHEENGSGRPWFMDDGFVSTHASKTPLATLRKAAKTGKWKVKKCYRMLNLTS